MSVKAEIDKAIGAHGMWKQRLLSAIESGKSDFTTANVAKDNLCDFGKWLYGPSIPAAAKAAADYETVRSLHAQFHKAASAVLATALAGNRKAAESAMGPSSEFAAVSGKLTVAMMAWKGKIVE